MRVVFVASDKMGETTRYLTGKVLQTVVRTKGIFKKKKVDVLVIRPDIGLGLNEVFVREKKEVLFLKEEK